MGFPHLSPYGFPFAKIRHGFSHGFPKDPARISVLLPFQAMVTVAFGVAGLGIGGFLVVMRGIRLG